MGTVIVPFSFISVVQGDFSIFITLIEMPESYNNNRYVVITSYYIWSHMTP